MAAVVCGVAALVAGGLLVAADDGSVTVRLAPEKAAPPVEDDYTLLVDLLEREPHAWGGAYLDDGVLVVRTVTREPEDAVDVLAAEGLTGTVRVRPGEISLERYRAAAEELGEHPGLRTVATSWDVHQRTGILVVGLRHGWWPRSPVLPVPTRVDGIPVVVEHGGQPVLAS